jgi:Domain of unknown function (DUF4185)
MGQDGGQSIDLGDRTLFVFSDSLFSLVPGRPRETLTAETGYFLGNCGALSPERSLTAALASLTYYTDAQGLPREIVAPTPVERLAGHRFWPQHGVAIGRHVYLYYLGLHQFDATSTWGFRPTGSGLARLDSATGGCERIATDANWCFWPVTADDIRLGTQVLCAGDVLYVFGTRRTPAGRHAILARVRAATIDDVSAYEYLSAATPAWSPRISDACTVVACANEVSVSFNNYLDSYLMVYVDDATKHLIVRIAKDPWGPYTDAVSAGRVPLRDMVNVVALAFEHPHFATHGGRTVVITYCQPNFTQNASVAVTFA